MLILAGGGISTHWKHLCWDGVGLQQSGREVLCEDALPNGNHKVVFRSVQAAGLPHISQDWMILNTGGQQQPADNVANGNKLDGSTYVAQIL